MILTLTHRTHVETFPTTAPLTYSESVFVMDNKSGARPDHWYSVYSHEERSLLPGPVLHPLLPSRADGERLRRWASQPGAGTHPSCFGACRSPVSPADAAARLHAPGAGTCPGAAAGHTDTAALGAPGHAASPPHPRSLHQLGVSLWIPSPRAQCFVKSLRSLVRAFLEETPLT